MRAIRRLWFAFGLSILFLYSQVNAAESVVPDALSARSNFEQVSEFPVKLVSFQTTREVLAGKWQKARTFKEKKKVIQRARKFVVTVAGP